MPFIRRPKGDRMGPSAGQRGVWQADRESATRVNARLHPRLARFALYAFTGGTPSTRFGSRADSSPGHEEGAQWLPDVNDRGPLRHDGKAVGVQ